jgi:gamma-glutamyltranspeptidase/glutathione hydrolase
MVVSASSIASEIGRNVLAAGGNAVDAAVATGFALAVTYPTAGNIGGGGFMVIRFPDGRATTIDFREAAPQRATPDMFIDSAGNYSYQMHHESYKSVGVPGTVAGFALAHQKYGKMPWARVVDPAVSLAGDGFVIPPGLAGSLARMSKHFRNPAAIAAYSKNGLPYATGERLRQPDLASTLTVRPIRATLMRERRVTSATQTLEVGPRCGWRTIVNALPRARSAEVILPHHPVLLEHRGVAH